MRDFSEIPERVAYARTPAKLPTILNGDEIVWFLEAVGPGLHGSSSAQFAMMDRWNIVVRNVEQVGDRIVDGDEALKLARRFEALIFSRRRIG